MAEPQAEPSQAPAPAPAAPAAPAPTPIEKVYKDFNIEDEAATFRPEPQAPAPAAAPVVPKVPDPFDPNFATYQAQLAAGMTSLSQVAAEMQGKLTTLERNLVQRQTEADIRQAVGTLTEGTGLEPDIVEVALEARARKDPKFLQIWNNRQKNPRALTAALDALKGEFKERFSVKQDPQLVENQRAIKASQQQQATTQKLTGQDRWAAMTPAERQAERDRIRRSGM